MKDKVLKVILIISSLPFVAVLLSAIWGAFFGVSTGFFGEQNLTYGLDAFWTCIVFRSMLFLQIGVFQICLIYQLFYLTRHFIKMKKLKEKEVDS